MKRTSLIFLLLTISACAGLPAQTFSLITGREPVTSLDGLWRFHTGDNPAWASPELRRLAVVADTHGRKLGHAGIFRLRRLCLVSLQATGSGWQQAA